jgi:hypothetical protein
MNYILSFCILVGSLLLSVSQGDDIALLFDDALNVGLFLLVAYLLEPKKEFTINLKIDRGQ